MADYYLNKALDHADAAYDKADKLEKDNAALRKELAEAKEISENCCKPAMAEVNRLREALEKYGRHRGDPAHSCRPGSISPKCYCGLSTALAHKGES